MGLAPFSDSKGTSDYSCTSRKAGYGPRTKTSPNPNKYRFDIISEECLGDYLIAVVQYPDCTTYNGYKTSVYKGVNTLEGIKELDPHFIENDNAPIARFPGNDYGLNLARQFVESLLLQSL
tara:strand:- start:357 stop:719 length:363 start_codon:yes stop_codon:yes gene_type:complete